MKKLLIATALLLSTGTAFAQQCGEEQASITPISVIQATLGNLLCLIRR